MVDWSNEIPDCVWQYWSHVDIMRSSPGMYHMDDRRAAYHDQICRAYGLTKEQTQEVTFHMDKFETAVDLALALEKLQMKHNKKDG